MAISRLFMIGALTALAGCHPIPHVRSVEKAPGIAPGIAPDGAPQAMSLFGEALFPPEIDAETRSQREANLAQAREDSLGALVWHGRRLAYLGHYRQAVGVYARAILVHPTAPELYRHRGHRYITLRRFSEAAMDLEKAAGLMANQPDAVEADGLPNAKNIPLGTLHFNVWYHLGLAYYLQDDLDDALRCYRRCLEVSANPDTVCATSHWLYMTLRRLDQDAEAAKVLEPIHEDMEIIENTGYHHLLLMYKGVHRPEQLLGHGEDDLANATVAYGVANWHCYNGRRAMGVTTLRRVLESSQWAAFGFIAAEADLKRMGESPR